MRTFLVGVLVGCGSVGPDLGEATGPWPRNDGCEAPPPLGFDPATAYAWSAPTPDHLVTSPASEGPGTLREALAQAMEGDVIGFAPDLAGQVIEVDDELIVRRSLTIDASAAPGVVLDGRGRTRIMTLEKALNSTLVGLTFRNGDTREEAGALWVRQADRGDPENPNPLGSVAIIGCRFEHNRGAAAGAVLVGWRIEAVIRDSVFLGNDGTRGEREQRGKSGGAVATRQNASLRIERSSFVGNRGAKSGAVYNILEPVAVYDSIFVDNEATEGSGAFFTDGGNGAGPSNDPDAGAVGEITLIRVRIQGNRGTGDGGALLLWGYPRDTIRIEHSVVHDNATTGDKGGAGRVHGLTDVRIVSSSFTDNHSGQQGGGLWIDGRGDVEIHNATFSGNSVERDAGAGFAYHGEGDLHVSHSLFAYNVAGRAAGAFWIRPAIEGTAMNNLFAFNEVGENQGERHLGGGRLTDLGGHLEFVKTDVDRGRAYPDSTFADPQLGALEVVNGTMLHAVAANSPAIDGGVAGGPEVDARGARRAGAPDIGPYEVGATCD
ncbi:MAG: right-handed parallel beta-helix repeat-containing protein [Myxococcota bacterium]